MNIPEATLVYFDQGYWCKSTLGQRGNGRPRCVGASLNLALTGGRAVQWHFDATSWEWYRKLAGIMVEQLPGLFEVSPNDLLSIPHAVIEAYNDHPTTTREQMRQCLEKLAADAD